MTITNTDFEDVQVDDQYGSTFPRLYSASHQLSGQTLTIQHTVIPVSYEGKQITIEKDRVKNKSSHRTLPLVPAFQELLQQIQKEQQMNRTLYKGSYSADCKDYIYLDKLGQRIKPGYITQHFPIVLEKHYMRRIRFHDLRHSCGVYCWRTV